MLSNVSRLGLVWVYCTVSALCYSGLFDLGKHCAIDLCPQALIVVERIYEYLYLVEKTISDNLWKLTFVKTRNENWLYRFFNKLYSSDNRTRWSQKRSSNTTNESKQFHYQSRSNRFPQRNWRSQAKEVIRNFGG